MWGLRDCTLEVPAGAIVGLVGPNGAGKTTLLEMIIGLLEPTEGRSRSSARAPARRAARLARVGYVAQDHPLYRDFSVADMFRLGRAMNPSWDQAMAAARMEALGIPLKRKIKNLSGGQRAQVALTMALAKRAPLLVLDEPVSSLDPIARLEFMRDVMASGGRHRPDRPDRLARCLRAGAALRLAGHPRRRARAARRAGRRPDHGPPAAHRAARHPGRRASRALIYRTDSDRHSTVLVRADPAGRAVRITPVAGRPGWLRAARAGLPAALARNGNNSQSRPGRRAARSHQQGGNTMIWVSWRQHRSQGIACLGLLAALAVYAIVVSSSMRAAFSHDGLAACLAHSQATNCRAAITVFTHEFGSLVNVAFWAVLLIVPGLIGVLVGAPLIARELEYGTWRLAWSQTVPRARWLAAKLALVTGGLVVFGAAMTAVITWYRAPMDRLTGHFLGNIYDFEGLVLTAYILCAFGFAVLAGLLLRRGIPAMIAAFIPWLAIRLVVEFFLRPHFLAPVTFRRPARRRRAAPASASCRRPLATSGTGCWASPATRRHHLYQPADRFWPFQLIEAGLFVALTAAALGATIWLLHRRAA